VVAPNGMIIDCSGPYAGTVADADMVVQSNLIDTLAQFCVVRNARGEEVDMCIYGDAGYGQSRLLHRPFSKVRMTVYEAHFNALMSRVRESVEHGIGSVVNEFPAFEMVRWQRSGQTNVTMRYLVAVIFRNMLTCVRGSNQISTFFGEDPPSLRTFARPRNAVNYRVAEIMRMIQAANEDQEQQ